MPVKAGVETATPARDSQVAPHLPPPTEIPLPGPSEPVKLPLGSPTGPELGGLDEESLENMAKEMTEALELLQLNDKTQVENQSAKRQLKLEDMSAAVWLPRLPKKMKSTDATLVTTLDTNEELRPVAHPHAKGPPATGVPHDSSPKDLSLLKNGWNICWNFIFIYIYTMFRWLQVCIIPLYVITNKI